MMELDPTELYYWRLEFDTSTVDQLTQRKLKPVDRIDPQHPPFDYGKVQRVVLVPRDSEYPEIVVEVPIGALPVCHRLMTRGDFGSGVLVGAQYRIGYRLGNKRTMKSVDLFTCKVSDVEDILSDGI
jgi:hypothetical protein